MADLHSGKYYAKGPILVTCGRGLSGYLAKEAAALGFEAGEIRENGVRLEGSLADCEKLNLCLRTATNVLFEAGRFSCDSADALYEAVQLIAWEEYIPCDEYLSVVSRVDTPCIDNSMFASLKVKDAIVDRIADKEGQRPDSGPNRDNVVVQLYWKGPEVRIYINTSGQKASDRGYRKIPFEAPMRESLAAGVVLATEYDGKGVFLNPMCGSGTLAIEAALIASGRAPGLTRLNFGFEHLKGFDGEKFRALRDSLVKESKKWRSKRKIGRILASDHDAEAIEAAKKNAQTAGVEHMIEFSVCDFADCIVPEEGGVVVMNPEYGMRLGDIQGLENLYKRMGDFFKQRCAGYTGYIFTGNMQLSKKIGLRTNRREVFYNGDIECRLLRYELYSGTRKDKGT